MKLWLACFALPTYLTCMHFSNIEGGASDGGILIQEGLCVCVCVQLSSLTMQRGGGGEQYCRNNLQLLCDPAKLMRRLLVGCRLLCIGAALMTGGSTCITILFFFFLSFSCQGCLGCPDCLHP